MRYDVVPSTCTRLSSYFQIARHEDVLCSLIASQAAFDAAAWGRLVRLADLLLCERVDAALSLAAKHQLRQAFVAQDDSGALLTLALTFNATSRTISGDPPLAQLLGCVTRIPDRLAAEFAAPRWPTALLALESGGGGPRSAQGNSSLSEAIRRACTALETAYADVSAFVESHVWLFEIASFARGWQDESVTGWAQRCGGIQAQLLRFREWQERMRGLHSTVTTRCGLLQLDCRVIKTTVEPRLKAIARDLNELLTTQLIQDCDTFLVNVAKCIADLSDYICISHPTAEEYATFVAGIADTKQREATLRPALDNIEELFLQRIRIDTESKQESLAAATLSGLQLSIQSRWSEFQGMLSAGAQLAKVLAPMMTHKLNIAISEQETIAREIVSELGGGCVVQPSTRIDRVLHELRAASERIRRVRVRQEALRGALQTVSGRVVMVNAIHTADRLAGLRLSVWQLCDDIDRSRHQWLREPFLAFDTPRMLARLPDWAAAADSLLEQLPHDKVLLSVQASVADLAALDPVLRKLSSKALREHHWRTLFAGLGRRWQADKPFTLRTLISLNPQRNSELVDAVYHQACAEHKAGAAISAMSEYWKTACFPFVQRPVVDIDLPHPLRLFSPRLRWRAALLKMTLMSRKYMMKRVVDVAMNARQGNETIPCMGDCTALRTRARNDRIRLGELLSLPLGVVEHVGALANTLNNELELVLEVLDVWESCQTLWMALHTALRAINAEYAAVVTQFMSIDLEYRKVLVTMHTHPLVLEALGRRLTHVGWRLLQGDSLRRLLLHLQASMAALVPTLERITLDPLCRQCPRLYFLPRVEVLRWFAAGSDTDLAANVLRACFMDVRRLVVATRPSGDRLVLGLEGCNGSSLVFDPPLSAASLASPQRLIDTMNSNMLAALGTCVWSLSVLEPGDDISQFLTGHLIQSMLTGLHIDWARRVQRALTADDGDLTLRLQDVQVFWLFVGQLYSDS